MSLYNAWLKPKTWMGWLAMCPISFLAKLAILPPCTWDKALTRNHQQQQKQCWVVHMLVRGLKLARTHTWPPPQNQCWFLPFYRVHMQECSLKMELAVHPVCHALYFLSNPYLFFSPSKKVSFYVYILHLVKDVVKNHFIHLSRHPFVHPSDHPSVSSWSVYSDGVEKEWNTDVAPRKIM